MENFKTSKFTAKDVFNSMSATPIKDAENQTLKVEAVAIKDKADGSPCGLIKASDGKIYVLQSLSLFCSHLCLISSTISFVGS